MTAPFRLNEIEQGSPLWRRLKAHMEERLTAKRRANDMPQSRKDTAMLRGRIAELKYLTEEIVRPPIQQDDGDENRHTATRAE